MRDDDETVAVAGNMLGKDFVAGFIVLWFFLSRNPCRVVTTSVDGHHLDVLWGEIRRFIQTSRYPLSVEQNGPLIVNHLHLRKQVNGAVDGLSYIIGRVAAKGEGMQGHHIAKIGDGVARTLFVADEASGIDDEDYRMADTWANRKLIIGNPWPCNNFFYRAVKGNPSTKDRGGNLVDPNHPDRFYRQVFRIRAEDSPNVQAGLAEQRVGKKPSGRILIPGVKPYFEYLKNRELWDPIQQCVSLDADFYEGAEVMLFPPEWLNLAEQLASTSGLSTQGTSMGVDSAAGGDNTCWAVVNKHGLIYLESERTPDTTKITGKTIALMRRFNIPSSNVLFDGGGGGKQHADRLRQQGHAGIRVVWFGEAATPEKRRGIAPLHKRKSAAEVSTAYKNRRAELYGRAREMLEPAPDGTVRFALPNSILNRPRPDGGPSLRQQLAAYRLQYDEEGRMFLPPKNKRDEKQQKQSLVDLIGCSPDEADAFVLATFGLQVQTPTFKISSLV